jgi:hypothetical protein
MLFFFRPRGIFWFASAFPSSLWAPLAAWLTLSIAISASLAGPPPLLEFDVPFAISCRDVTPKDFPKKNPGKEVVEVVVRVSTWIKAGTEKDLKQCLFTLVDPGSPETLVVTDWLPRTKLDTEFAKPIHINREKDAKLGINLSAHYGVTAAGDASGQVKSAVTYEMLPPREIVLASGTIRQGHGVFYKLRPSTQTTLEGMKSFCAIFAVPRGWRGGCLKLECEAIGSDRGLVPPLDREVTSGLAIFCLALYREGDTEAQRLAERVASRQQELFDALVRDHREVMATCRRCSSWLGHTSGKLWFLGKFGLPADAPTAPGEAALLNYVIDRAGLSPEQLEELPRPVMDKLLALEEATAALAALSGNVLP